jgi:hypothetical protein
MVMASLSTAERARVMVPEEVRARQQPREEIVIVALARKFLIAFWRYLETGMIPEGAVLRA